MIYRIIFDNGGGATLQVDKFPCPYHRELTASWAQHYFNQPFALASALRAYICGDPLGQCCPDAVVLSPTDTQVRNGQYRIFYDVADALSAKDSGWRNIEEFAKAWEANQ